MTLNAIDEFTHIFLLVLKLLASGIYEVEKNHMPQLPYLAAHETDYCGRAYKFIGHVKFYRTCRCSKKRVHFFKLRTCGHFLLNGWTGSESQAHASLRLGFFVSGVRFFVPMEIKSYGNSQNESAKAG
ncbi:MAG TPA: hypothetical protein VGD65_09995 [Chryseosolibacter sp.]